MNAKTRQNHFTRRTASATIEFVYALPFLLLLMVGLTWLGNSMLGQAEVNLEARLGAWKQHGDNPNADAFIFTSHPGYDGNKDFAIGEAEKPVNVSKLFDGSDPLAKQIVLAGSWDHQALPLDELPNWKAYGKAVINAKTGNVQNLLGGMDNFQNIVRDVGASILSSQLNQLTGIGGSAASASTQQQSQQSQEERRTQTRKRELVARKAELEPEIRELERQKQRQGDFLLPKDERKLFRLKSELSDNEIELRELK